MDWNLGLDCQPRERQHKFCAEPRVYASWYNSATDKFIFRNPWNGGSYDGIRPANAQFEAPFEEFWNSNLNPLIALTETGSNLSANYSYSISSDSENESGAVAEGGSITFVITRDKSGTESTIYLSTLSGTANAADYNAIEKKAISFGPQETVKTVKIKTFSDTISEGVESFTLALFKDRTSPSSDASSAAYINNVDAGNYNYSISSSASVASKAVEEGGSISFTITRDGEGTASTVYLTTADGTAGDEDYLALDNFEVSFADYETSKTVKVETLNDSLTEGAEQFSLNLSKNPNSEAVDSTADGFIKAPTFQNLNILLFRLHRVRLALRQRAAR